MTAFTPRPELSERQWQAHVMHLAALHGWTLTYHTHRSEHSAEGWPDLVLVHPRRRRALFVELKTNTGRLTIAQRMWLRALEHAGLEVTVWRPRDLSAVLAALGPLNARIALPTEEGTA